MTDMSVHYNMQSLLATDEPIHIVNVGLCSESSEHYSDSSAPQVLYLCPEQGRPC